MSTAQTRREAIRAFLPSSPFPNGLGIELVDVEDGRATLRMPYRDELATIGDTVHGGAIATLLDTAAMVGAWSGDETFDSLAGATVALSVTYIGAARGSEIVAEANVLRRGRSLSFVDVIARAEDRIVAQATATYRFG